MAESAVIGALRVVLGLDSATFEKGLKNSLGLSDSFAKSISHIAGGIGLEHGMEKLLDGIIDGLKEAVKHADEMGKMAQKVGLPVEELTKLKLAADLSDVSMESLSTGLGKLSKAMLEVSQGGGAAASTFKSLGISVTNSDGTLRSAGDVLADVAGKFGGVSDGAAKTATAMVLFGKSGKDLIPLLNEGKSGLEEMMHAAQNMGLVISTQTSAQSQKFMDNIKLLDLAKQGLVNTVTAALLPAFVRLTDQWVDTAKSGDAMRIISDRIVDSIKQMITFAYQAVAADEILGKAFVALQAAAAEFLSKGVWGDASKHLEEFTRLWNSLPGAMKGASDKVDALFLKLTVHPKATANLDITGPIQKAIDELAFKTRILKGDFDSLAQGFPDLAKGVVPIEQIKTSVAALTPALQLLNAAQLQFKGAQLTQDSLLPWQLYEQQLARIEQLYAAGAISAETYAQAIRKSAESTGQAWNMAASEIVGNLATGLKAFAEQNKSLSGIAKAAAIAQAVINTYTAATKALATYPPPLSYIAAGAAVVAGLGYVAQIKAQQFAAGGSFMVPGGVSGVDNKFVPLNLASGEMVDITPANDVGRARTEVTVNLLGDSVSRNKIKEMFDTLNQGYRDGYRLKLAS